MLNNEEFTTGINKILADNILSQKAKDDLEDISDNVRMAIEALIVEGEILERNGRYYPKGWIFDD
jgi:hypothetical protein